MASSTGGPDPCDGLLARLLLLVVPSLLDGMHFKLTYLPACIHPYPTDVGTLMEWQTCAGHESEHDATLMVKFLDPLNQLQES